MTDKRSARFTIAAIITLCMFALLASCGGGGGDSGSSSGQSGSIVLSGSVASIPADGTSSATITATIRDGNGNPVSHFTNVTFTTTLGHFRNGGSSYTVQTLPPLTDGKYDLDAAPTGVVSVALIAGTTSGSAKVSVTSNGVTQTLYVTMTGGAASITLTASPVKIPADGLSSSTITATLLSSTGSPVTPGTEVTFRTNLGSFAASTDSGQVLGNVFEASQTYTVQTPDATGVVRVSLVAGGTVGSARVTATSNNITQVVYVGFGGDPVAINLTANPISIPADGASSSTITAVLTDASGAAVTQGTLVTFTTTLGSFLNGSTVYTVATPDSGGRVSVSLISATGVGSARVTATSNGIRQTVYVGFGGAAVAISVSASPTSIWADGESSAAIQATVTDSTGASVTPGTPVMFTTTLGTFQNGSSSYTVSTQDSSGIVTASLIAGLTTGTARVTVTANNVSQSVYVAFTQKGGAAVSMTLETDPDSIPADGSSSAKITATLTDSVGNPVNPGTSVTFSTTLGRFSNGSKTYTVTTPDAAGVVVVSLISGTTSGAALVIATATGVTQSVYVTFEGGAVTIELAAKPTSIPADGVSSATITATLKDTLGEPVIPGTSVTFETNLGTFSNQTQTITVDTVDDTGIVSVALIADTTPGTATVTATSESVSQAVTVEFTGGVPTVGSVTVSANPAVLDGDGTSTSIITALVKTADNQVIADAQVSFVTTRGAITSPHTTDATGQAAATLTSARYNDGSVTVTATCQGQTGTTLVAFTGVTLTLEADKESLESGDSTNLKATLLDAANNPIPQAPVNLLVTEGAGTFTPASPWTTDAAGEATGIFTLTSNQTAKLLAQSRGAEAELTLNYVIYTFTMEDPNPSSIRVNGETSTITVLLEENGVPKAGETVNFSTTLGTLAPYSQVTGVDGKATTILTSGSQAGSAVVDANVTVGGKLLTASDKVTITGGTAVKVVLTADPETVPTDTGVSTLTAKAYDANDQPVGGQDIYFRINAGPGGGEYLAASVKTTNIYGIATVKFYAGALSSTLGGVEIEANTLPTFAGSYGLTNLTIAGPVANIGIGMNLETLEPAGGSLKIDIAGIATDVNGNPVADGTKIRFGVTAVEFNEDRAHDFTIECWDILRQLIVCPPTGTPGFGTTWFSDDVNQDGTMYTLGGAMCTTEDVNHNGILDPGEDKNDNGVIDPIQGCTIDDSVETKDGVADTTLIYPAPQAENIKVRITAEAGGVTNFYETILLCTAVMVDNGTCGIGY